MITKGRPLLSDSGPKMGRPATTATANRANQWPGFSSPTSRAYSERKARMLPRETPSRPMLTAGMRDWGRRKVSNQRRRGVSVRTRAGSRIHTAAARPNAAAAAAHTNSVGKPCRATIQKARAGATEPATVLTAPE